MRNFARHTWRLALVQWNWYRREGGWFSKVWLVFLVIHLLFQNWYQAINTALIGAIVAIAYEMNAERKRLLRENRKLKRELLRSATPRDLLDTFRRGPR